MGINAYRALAEAGAASLLILSLGLSTLLSSGATADSAADEDHCIRSRPPEQSIVVSTQTGDDAQVIVSDEDEPADALEPIANVSEYEPELAEPVTEKPLVPALAEPPIKQPETQKLAKLTRQQPAKKNAPVEPEAISFHGITPGQSKRINVLRTWGDPRSDDTQASTLLYRFDDLQSVKVRFSKHQVDAIAVRLGDPLPVAALTAKLQFDDIQPAIKTAANGKARGQIYPERGVTLLFADGSTDMAFASDDEQFADEADQRLVSEIVIRPILAQPFLIRANQATGTDLARTIADLEAAIKIDRTLVEARDHLSEIYLLTGKAVTAERYSAEAVELAPNEPRYHLQRAKSLRHLARYDQAVEEVRQVLETPNVAPLLRAQALNEMGLLASLGSPKVAKRAMPLHSKAIDIADGLSLDEDPLVTQQAMDLLVDAHLAIAVQISQGDWEGKDDSVPQWIERASALAEAAIDEDPVNMPLRLKVAVSALAAAANMEKPIDPTLWIAEAEETTATIQQDLNDPLTRGQYDWLLGLAYFHGAQIEHRRSEADSALRLGERADQQLSELAKTRDELPDTGYLMGRLYFQIGAIHAVHNNDHAAACRWYDRAVDRLLNPVPVTTMVSPQQHGDALVSMGVSYWNQQERQRAIEVTESGLELIEQAVESGLLNAKSLLVPYNNLAAMYQAEGEKEPAARYEELARQVTGSKVSQKPQPKNSKRR